MIDLIAATVLTVHLGSHHLHPDQEFEEFNPGLGVEIHDAPGRFWTADLFRDSHRNTATGVGRGYFTEWSSGTIRTGVTVGLIHHTEWKGPFAHPWLSVGSDTARARLSLLPGRNAPTIALSAKFTF